MGVVVVEKKSKPKRTRADNDPDATRARQGAFIAAYGEVGSVAKAAKAAGVPWGTVKSWMARDTYEFKTKYETAKEIFREYIQDVAWQRILSQKPGDNPLLLLNFLQAHWPEKYRRDANVGNNDYKEMMGEWKKWVREQRKGVKDKDSAEVREVEEARQNAISEVEHILSRKKRNDASPE